MIESDYQTAEVRALAFISGDQALIDLITLPDKNFAVTKSGEVVRIGFVGTELSANRFADVLYTLFEKGKPVRRVPLTELALSADGKIIHPKADLHWALAEDTHKFPRELLDKNKDRDPAKIVRFSGTYGASGATLDRKIESDTGMKPEEGTGDRTLAALRAKQPVATAHQEALMYYPEEPGYYQSESGRYRHFRMHPENLYAISSRMRQSILSALGREALNFPYQEIVAATAARAANWLLADYRRLKMKALPMVVLYDAIVTLAPVEERFTVKTMHQKYMCDDNTWNHHDRVWNFPIDTSFSYAWAGEPTKEQQAQLEDPTWASDPTVLS